MNRLALCAVSALFVLAAPLAGAQAPAPAVAVEVRAVRVESPPAIDGDLSDAAWSSAPEITGLTQREPEENRPPTHPTSVRIVYDESAIYFGVRLHDDQPVTAVVGRRDDHLFTDSFAVQLDSHHDHRSAVSFQVSAANVQTDAVIFNDTSEDNDWDAVWSSATKITPEGWTLEMRIPYSQLRFPRRDVHVWGINFNRFIARLHENDWLVSAPKNESIRVSQAAHLIGIEGIAPRRAFELIPYVVGRSDFLGTVKSNDPLNDATSQSLDAGLDLRYPITSNLTLSAALNPDFGQVEVDPAVVNLSQFETFYPEKRPFFLEGATLFDFGSGGSNSNFGFNFSAPDLFYSRRIGREPQLSRSVDSDWLDAPKETTILGAAKVTGKTQGGWTIAAMDAVTDEENARFVLDEQTGDTVIEPMTNYFVSRFARDLGTRGRVGAMFTSVNRNLDDDHSLLRSGAYTGGVDGYWAFGNRDLIWEWSLGSTLVEGSEESIAATQRSSARYYNRPDADHVDYDPTRTSLTGWGARSMIAKQTGKWRYNMKVETFSPGFESNDVGYMTRTDTTATHATVMYTDAETRGPLLRRNYWLGKYQNWNFDGDLIANGVYGSAFFLFTNYWDVTCSGGYGAAALDDRLTRGGPLARRMPGYGMNCNGSTDSRKKLFVEFGVDADRSDSGSSFDEIEFGVRYRPRDNVSFTVSPEYSHGVTDAQYVRVVDDPSAATYGRRYVFGELDQRTFELGTRLDWTFSSRLTFQLYLQPFVSAGQYSNFKELSRARSYDFNVYGRDGASIDFDPEGNSYTIDPDGSGDARSFVVGNPDFNIRSLRGSAVLRWEFRPGSALYVAWNENRAGATGDGEFRVGRDLSEIVDAESDDVFLVKLSYWLPM